MARRGFTLIELLVVIAVIGILIAIAVPVFNVVSNRARGTQCLSNMRELGTALNLYQTSHQGTYPPALINPGSYCAGGSCMDPPPGRIAPVVNATEFPAGTKQHTLNTTGWTQVLAFLDKGSLLYQKYNFNLASGPAAFNSIGQWPVGTNGSPPGTAFCGENATVVSTNLEFFVCPADPSPPDGTYMATSTNSPYARLNAAPCNYVFSTGEYDERANTYGYYRDMTRRVAKLKANPPTYLPPLGVFGINGAANFKDIVDGPSKTILIGEAIRKKDRFPSPFGKTGQENAGGFWGVGTYTSITAQVYPVDAQECATDPDDAKAKKFADLYSDLDPKHYRINTKGAGGKYPPPGVFSSYHSGGANFVFCDNSAKFIADTIDLKVLYKLATADAADWPLWKGQKKKEMVEIPD